MEEALRLKLEKNIPSWLVVVQAGHWQTRQQGKKPRRSVSDCWKRILELPRLSSTR
jgi:hypothetical protein